MQNWNRINNLTQILKSGNKIHIKKENRGKFTKSAKAAGHSVQEHARAVLNDPNATPLQKKRANFARNAAKWHRKHFDGGTIDSSNTFNGIKTTNNRPYDSSLISYINDKLRDGGMSKTKRAAVLANIIEESGGNPFAKGPGGFYGLLQWSNGRYAPTQETDTFKELNNQINYILQTEGNSTDRKSWTHGGKGSGYNSVNDAIKAFNENNLKSSTRGFTLGYVRPAGGLDSLSNRYSVAKQIYNNPKFYQRGGNLTYTPFLQDEEINKDVYTPFIPEITSDYTPSFPIESVKNYTPVEQAPEQSKKESKQEDKTPKFEIQQVTAPKDAVVVNTPSVEKILGNVEYKTSNMDVGNMQELIDLMKDEGISFRITSGHRPGAKTKNGKLSHHDAGNALDITPASEQTWDDLIAQMKKSSRFIEYMKSHGFGILDERGDAMQKRTGATGAHFHIGPDQIARTQFKYLIG